MLTIRDILTQLASRKGWHVVRCPQWMAVTIYTMEWAKVQVCGNAPDTYQMRITGDGKMWLRRQEVADV